MTIALNELDIAWTLLGQQRFVQAARQAESILKRFPSNVSALACHAMAMWKAGGDIEQSLAEMRRAVALAPDVASIRHNFATVLASRGDIAEAAHQFGEALRIKPDDTLAFYGQTQNAKFTEETDGVRAMLALHGDDALDAERREFLDFGLAKVFDDLGDAPRAMRYAIEANELGQRPFDRAGETAALAALGELARVDAFRSARNSGHPSTAPLFIVGMNRSGTTLVESILSRHPDVLAQGEMGQMLDLERAAQARLGPAAQGRSRHEVALGLSRDWLAAQAEALMKQAVGRSTGAFKIATDKLPENAVRLGLVARLFPRARVIHVRRHPLDTGVSNFFQRVTVGQGHSNRLDWIGARTRQIADSMVIWRQALDLPVLDVSYEKLVTDPEAQSRRILDFAGLEWTPDCLEPERTQRSVFTASQWQVRQPIYRSSLGRWTRYEPWLGPMIEAMGGFAWIDREVDAISG
jgi:tetratricopeptide (TPR) repeat protein